MRLPAQQTFLELFRVQAVRKSKINKTWKRKGIESLLQLEKGQNWDRLEHSMLILNIAYILILAVCENWQWKEMILTAFETSVVEDGIYYFFGTPL